MAKVLQTQIDSAVRLGKSAVSTLANELALERKYGGKTDCCDCTLGVLWGWVHTLSCQKEVVTTAVSAEATVTFTEFTSAGAGSTIDFLVDGVSIVGGPIAVPSLPSNPSLSTIASTLASTINSTADAYTAVANGVIVTIKGPCNAGAIATAEDKVGFRYVKSLAVGGSTISVTLTQFTGGKCVYAAENNCMTEDEAKELIGKINSLCTSN